MRMLLVPLFIAMTGCTTTLGQDAPRIQATPSPDAQAYTHYLVSVLERRSGRFEAEAESMRKAAELAPWSNALTMRLIETYLRMNDAEQAAIYCEKALEDDPDNAALWMILWNVYQQQEEYEKAAYAFQRAKDLEPDAGLYGALLRAAEAANDLTSATDLYAKLVEARPNSALLHYRLALALYEINDREKSLEHLEAALELGLSDSDRPRALGLLGFIQLELGRDAEAEGSFRALLEAEPENAAAREELAAVLARQERYGEALDELAHLVESGEGKARHYLQAMYVLLRTEQYEDVEDMAPPSGAPVLGTVLRAAARRALERPYLPLIESLDRADGDVNAEANEHLSQLIFMYTPEAMGTFLLDTVGALRESGVASRRLDVLHGRILMALERDGEAAQALEAVLAQYGAEKAVHYQLASLYERMDNFEATERHLKRCLELDPDDAEVMNFLGYLYAEHNTNLEMAESLLKRALDYDPNNGFYLDSLGWVYYRMGDADQAIAYIRQAILNMQSDDAVLRDHLGDAYLLKGDVEKAVLEWKRALRLDPELEGVSEKIEAHRVQRTSAGSR